MPSVGIARIEELDHWLTDALGAYFEGALYLLAFIFLYRLATLKMEERRSQKSGRAGLSSLTMDFDEKSIPCLSWLERTDSGPADVEMRAPRASAAPDFV